MYQFLINIIRVWLIQIILHPSTSKSVKKFLLLNNYKLKFSSKLTWTFVRLKLTNLANILFYGLKNTSHCLSLSLSLRLLAIIANIFRHCLARYEKNRIASQMKASGKCCWPSLQRSFENTASRPEEGSSLASGWRTRQQRYRKHVATEANVRFANGVRSSSNTKRTDRAQISPVLFRSPYEWRWNSRPCARARPRGVRSRRRATRSLVHPTGTYWWR